MSEPSGEVTFQQNELLMNTLSAMGGTLPPMAALAVVARVGEIVASAEPTPSTEQTIVRAMHVIVTTGDALRARTPPHPVETGYAPIVEWWARALCAALYTPVLLAVVEGHLRNLEAGASKNPPGTVENEAGSVAHDVLDNVFTPNAQHVFQS